MGFIITECDIASAEVSTEETMPKSHSCVLGKDSISLFWYFKPKIVLGLSDQPLSTCELPWICESQWSQILFYIYGKMCP